MGERHGRAGDLGSRTMKVAAAARRKILVDHLSVQRMDELDGRTRLLWVPADKAGAQELLERLDRGRNACQSGNRRQRRPLVDDRHACNDFAPTHAFSESRAVTDEVSERGAGRTPSLRRKSAGLSSPRSVRRYNGWPPVWEWSRSA